MKRPLRLDVLLIVVVPLIDLLGVAVALAAENGNFPGLVDIGSGRKMYLKGSGTGSPTVVLVGGLRAAPGSSLAKLLRASERLAQPLRTTPVS